MDTAFDEVSRDAPSRLGFGVFSTTLASRRLSTVPEDMKPLIPKWDERILLDYESSPLISAIALSVAQDQPLLIVGPKGAGKTTAVYAMAALLRQPLVRINMREDFKTSAFVGYRTPDGWREGLLPRAMKAGAWLLIDEFDACPPGIAMTLQSVLEEGRTLVVTDNGGEVVRPSGRLAKERRRDGSRYDIADLSTFRIFATSNTRGFGDESGLYAGTSVQNRATMDRFAVLEIDYMPKDEEVKVLTSATGVDATIAEALVNMAFEVRRGFDSSSAQFSDVISTRQLLMMCEQAMAASDGDLGDVAVNGVTQYAMSLAYKMHIGNKLPTTDQSAVAGLFKRATGVDIHRV